MNMNVDSSFTLYKVKNKSKTLNTRPKTAKKNIGKALQDLA